MRDDEDILEYDEKNFLTDSSLKLYIKDVNNFKMIDFDEEKRLAELIKKGDKEARNKLVESNLRLVMALARQYKGCGLSYQDLVQEGNFGLIKAADKFDISLGYRFSTYATWWIKQTIGRAIADHGKIIRVPAHIVETLNKIKKTERDLTIILGREPTNYEVAFSLNITEQEVQDIKQYNIDATSLDIQVGDEEDTTVESFVEDENAINPELYCLKKANKDAVKNILSSLSERESKILQMRFGFETGKDMTLEEVGEEFGLTKERIRQIETKAFRKLRHPYRANALRECMG